VRLKAKRKQRKQRVLTGTVFADAEKNTDLLIKKFTDEEIY
jgi:hypothetical protein